MRTPGCVTLGATALWCWRAPCHGRLLCTVGCWAASLANSIPSLSFENQKSPDIAKCLLGGEITQLRSAGLREDRPYLQTPVILNSVPQIVVFVPVQLLLVHTSLFRKNKTNNNKKNRKPAHHKIISRIGLQSRAFVLVSSKKNLHMKIFSSKDSIHHHILCPQTYLQIPIWKYIKGQMTIFL